MIGVNGQRRQLINHLYSQLQVQSVAVNFLRLWKNFVKYMIDMAVIYDKIWKRDNVMKLPSPTHFMFSAVQFQNLIRYVWYLTGIFNEKLGDYLTPMVFCIDGADGLCTYKESEGCSKAAFMRYTHCELFLLYSLCCQAPYVLCFGMTLLHFTSTPTRCVFPMLSFLSCFLSTRFKMGLQFCSTQDLMTAHTSLVPSPDAAVM